MSFVDKFSERADLYASARPSYPDALFHFVASLTQSRGRAWDCGTGNGQAAMGLARYFDVVEASDASEQQIKNAIPHERVHYSVQPAEKTSFSSASFDVVCVAQALHWFDFDRFYPEVRRVLKPDGAFVAWAYDWFHVSRDFDVQFDKSVLDALQFYWAPQNKLAWSGYRDVPFPFTRLDVPEIEMEMSWTFPQLMAYVATWSATRRRMAESGAEFFENAERELSHHWGRASDRRRIRMHLHLLAGRGVGFTRGSR